MNKNCSIICCERRMKPINIRQVEICSMCNIINMGFKGQCAIKNDTS